MNPLTGLDSSRTHALPLSSRPLGLGRNSLETPAAVSLDLLVLKYFPFGGRDGWMSLWSRSTFSIARTLPRSIRCLVQASFLSLSTDNRPKGLALGRFNSRSILSSLTDRPWSIGQWAL